MPCISETCGIDGETTYMLLEMVREKTDGTNVSDSMKDLIATVTEMKIPANQVFYTGLLFGRLLQQNECKED